MILRVLVSQLPMLINGVARSFRDGVRNCVIVSQQCPDFLIPSLATAVDLPFHSQHTAKLVIHARSPLNAGGYLPIVRINAGALRYIIRIFLTGVYVRTLRTLYCYDTDANAD